MSRNPSKKRAQINVRIDGDRYDALKAAADQLGLSQSELMRHLVDEHLSEWVRAAERTEELPSELISAAGHGNVEAMRDIADMLSKWWSDPLRPAWQRAMLFGVAEFCQRMATSHGEPHDMVRLSGYLFTRAEHYQLSPDEVAGNTATAVALLNCAADAGVGSAVDRLANVKVLGLPDDVIALSEELCETGALDVVRR